MWCVRVRERVCVSVYVSELYVSELYVSDFAPAISELSRSACSAESRARKVPEKTRKKGKRKINQPAMSV